MVGGIDSDEFVIAERLHMTVAELRERMPNNEYHQWRAYLTWKAAMQEQAMKEAKSSARSR